MSRPAPILPLAERLRQLHTENALRPLALALTPPDDPQSTTGGGPSGAVPDDPADGAASRSLTGTIGIVKDDIAVTGFPLTCGSLALEGLRPHRDAAAVAALRGAGAHVAGKANLSEWAGGRSSLQVRGWSSLGGQLSHAKDSRFSPGGSSSGSAVAVALGLVDWALGSETVGSVVQPASLNGVFGLKPTLGAIPTDGLAPLDGALTQTTIGIFAQSAQVVAQVFEVAAHREKRHLTDGAVSVAGRAQPSLPRRVTLIRSAPPDMAELFEYVTVWLEELLRRNQVAVTPEQPVPPQAAMATMQRLLTLESRYYHDRFLGQLPPDHPQSLAELVAFNRAHRTGVTGYDDQEWFEMALAGPQPTPEAMKAHGLTRAALREETSAYLDRLFDQSDSEVLLAVTERPSWRIDTNGPDPEPFWLPALPCVSGYPHLSVPGLAIDGWPVGISLIGRPGSDLQLIRSGAALHTILLDAEPPSIRLN